MSSQSGISLEYNTFVMVSYNKINVYYKYVFDIQRNPWLNKGGDYS